MVSVLAYCLKFGLRLLVVLCSLQTQAQVLFDDMAVGQVVSGGVALGRFGKPLPLPEGNWLLLGKHVADYKLLDGKVVPLHVVSLKNSDPGNTMAAVVLAYIPRQSINISWLKEPCTSSDAKVIVNPFEGVGSEMFDLCALTLTTDTLHQAAPKGATDNVNFYKFIVPEIQTHAKELPPKGVWVAVMGSRFLDKKVFYNFLIRTEAELLTDEAYRAQINTWTKTTGQAIYQVLDGSSATITTAPRGAARPQPKAPPATPPQAALPRPNAEAVAASEAAALAQAREAAAKRLALAEKEKADAERQKLAAQKMAERKEAERKEAERKEAERKEAERKDAERKEAERKEAERKLALERAKSLCLSAYIAAVNETTLRQFIQDFPNDECGQHSAANRQLADLDEKQQAVKRKEDRERQVKMDQARALIGAVVQFQQTFGHCFAPAGSGPCTSANYVFAVRGKILDINTQLNDEIRVEVTDVTLQPVADNPAAQAGAKAAEQAFRKKMLGSKVIRTKADLGLVF